MVKKDGNSALKEQKTSTAMREAVTYGKDKRTFYKEYFAKKENKEHPTYSPNQFFTMGLSEADNTLRKGDYYSSVKKLSNALDDIANYRELSREKYLEAVQSRIKSTMLPSDLNTRALDAQGTTAPFKVWF